MNVDIALRVLLLTVALALMPQQAGSVQQAGTQSMPRAWSLPLRTQEALEAYLRDRAGEPTPFDALPPGARERFFFSLYWGLSGLGSMDVGILADELTQPQIEAILHLFGDDIAAYAPRSRLSMTEAPPVAVTEISILEQRYTDFYRILRKQGELDTEAFATHLSERFDAIADAYTTESLRAMDQRHRAMLWNAASTAAMLLGQPQYVEAMEAVLAEIARHDAGKMSVGKLLRLRDALLAAQRFDDALNLSERYPDAGLPPLPDIIDPFSGNDAPDRTIWVLSADDDRLTRHAIVLEGTRLLVVSSYNCGFSRNAAEDIAADPVLGPVFSEHATWLMQPPGRETIEAAAEWNRRFPQAPSRLIYRFDEWPMSPSWSTPTFHVIHDGRIVDTVTGWSRNDDSHRRRIIEMLARADLMEPTAPAP